MARELAAVAFDQIAPFYDELMGNVPYGAWLEYLLLVHAYASVRPKSVLDVCCGTGTLTEALAAQGYEAVGVDLSSAMVQVARRKGMARYHVGDVRTFDLGTTFDAAFSFFDSLNYVADLDGFRSAVRRVAAHLRAGGTFLFDLNTAYAFEQRMFDLRERSSKASVQYDWVGDYDPGERIIRVSMDFRVGGRTVHDEHVQRAHSHEEVLAALADAGFASCEVFDGFTLNPPTDDSDRLHYLAIRG
jgi:SAM-dependent methyltransferase